MASNAAIRGGGVLTNSGWERGSHGQLDGLWAKLFYGNDPAGDLPLQFGQALAAAGLSPSDYAIADYRQTGSLPFEPGVSQPNGAWPGIAAARFGGSVVDLRQVLPPVVSVSGSWDSSTRRLTVTSATAGTWPGDAWANTPPAWFIDGEPATGSITNVRIWFPQTTDDHIGSLGRIMRPDDGVSWMVSPVSGSFPGYWTLDDNGQFGWPSRYTGDGTASGRTGEYYQADSDSRIIVPRSGGPTAWGMPARCTSYAYPEFGRARIWRGALRWIQTAYRWSYRDFTVTQTWMPYRSAYLDDGSGGTRRHGLTLDVPQPSRLIYGPNGTEFGAAFSTPTYNPLLPILWSRQDCILTGYNDGGSPVSWPSMSLDVYAANIGADGSINGIGAFIGNFPLTSPPGTTAGSGQTEPALYRINPSSVASPGTVVYCQLFVSATMDLSYLWQIDHGMPYAVAAPWGIIPGHKAI